TAVHANAVDVHDRLIRLRETGVPTNSNARAFANETGRGQRYYTGFPRLEHVGEAGHRYVRWRLDGGNRVPELASFDQTCALPPKPCRMLPSIQVGGRDYSSLPRRSDGRTHAQGTAPWRRANNKPSRRSAVRHRDRQFRLSNKSEKTHASRARTTAMSR